MIATTVETVPTAGSRQLRLTLRDRLEAEFVRLRDSVRRELLATLETADEGSGAAAVKRAVTMADYHIAAIQAELGTGHEPHPDQAVCGRCCVLVDRGTGPQWLVLAALPEQGLPVIASDSALGRALIGARRGQTVEYPDPRGPQTARVLALESV